MKRNLTDENFERFLQDQVDDLRMHPSDKVWKGISKDLNKDRRRVGFLLLFTLLLTGGASYYFATDHQLVSESRTSANTASTFPVSLTPDNYSPASIAPEQSGDRTDQNDQTSRVQAPVISINRSSRGLHIKASGTIPPASESVVIDHSTDLYRYSEMELPASQRTPPELFGVDGIKELPVTAPVMNLPTLNDHRKTNAESQITLPQNPEVVSESADVASADPSAIKIASGRPKRLTTQLYLTPTVSYRKLNDEKVEDVTTHKPDFGFEIGFAAKYAVARKLKVRGGLQFNVNRYSIKTFTAPTEIATIRLTTGRTANNVVATTTNYNNFSGYKSDWLQNFYFQAAIPLGLELKLRGDEKTQFGIASTIQPTYIIGDKAYLISTDYKNYAQVPSLTRRFNLNTSFETFVAYSTGHLKWQVGPQVRYQLRSSFLKSYPVKENLFDFGFKVGIGLNH